MLLILCGETYTPTVFFFLLRSYNELLKLNVQAVQAGWKAQKVRQSLNERIPPIRLNINGEYPYAVRNAA